MGGVGADHFLFRAGYGRDTVVGFEDGIDKLDLSSFNLTAQQLSAAGRDVGVNVQFDFGGGNVLTILNITEARLAGDIIL